MSAAITYRPDRTPVALRPYQKVDLEAIYKAFKSFRRVLYVIATGAGKTVVAGRYIEQQVLAGKCGLIIIQTGELVEQMVATCLRFALDADQIGVLWQDDTRTNPGAPLRGCPS